MCLNCRLINEAIGSRQVGYYTIIPSKSAKLGVKGSISYWVKCLLLTTKDPNTGQFTFILYTAFCCVFKMSEKVTAENSQLRYIRYQPNTSTHGPGATLKKKAYFNLVTGPSTDRLQLPSGVTYSKTYWYCIPYDNSINKKLRVHSFGSLAWNIK